MILLVYSYKERIIFDTLKRLKYVSYNMRRNMYTCNICISLSMPQICCKILIAAPKCIAMKHISFSHIYENTTTHKTTHNTNICIYFLK